MLFVTTAILSLLSPQPCVAKRPHAETTSNDLLESARKELGHTFPKWLLSNYTLDNLRDFVTPAYFVISHDGEPIAKKRIIQNSGSKADAVEKKEQMLTPTKNEVDSDVSINPAVIWQIGKALWELVNDNQATVNYTTDWAGAVPANISDWTQLTNWQTWSSKMYKFEFKNFVGMKLTEFEWKYTCQYSGKYQGVGEYLTLCGASINTIYAYTTEHVDASAKGSNPFNYGTKENPIGGLNLQVIMSSHGLFEKTTVGCQITMKGDATYTVIQCDQN